MKTYWMSFANDEGCLGVVIMDAEDEAGAVRAVMEAALHPGGQVMLLDVTDMPGVEGEISKWGKNRLMSAADLRGDEYKSLSELPDYITSQIERDPRVSMVCEKHAP